MKSVIRFSSLALIAVVGGFSSPQAKAAPFDCSRLPEPDTSHLVQEIPDATSSHLEVSDGSGRWIHTDVTLPSARGKAFRVSVGSYLLEKLSLCAEKVRVDHEAIVNNPKNDIVNTESKAGQTALVVGAVLGDVGRAQRELKILMGQPYAVDAKRGEDGGLQSKYSACDFAYDPAECRKSGKEPTFSEINPAKLGRLTNELRGTILQYHSVLRAALGQCKSLEGDLAKGEAVAKGPCARYLEEQLATMEAHDEKVGKKTWPFSEIFKVKNLFGEVKTENGKKVIGDNIVLSAFGIEQIACGGGSCTFSDPEKLPKPEPKPEPAPVEEKEIESKNEAPAPAPKPQLNPGKADGKSLGSKEILSTSKALVTQLEGLADCAKVHSKSYRDGKLANAELSKLRPELKADYQSRAASYHPNVEAGDAVHQWIGALNDAQVDSSKVKVAWLKLELSGGAGKPGDPKAVPPKSDYEVAQAWWDLARVNQGSKEQSAQYNAFVRSPRTMMLASSANCSVIGGEVERLLASANQATGESKFDFGKGFNASNGACIASDRDLIEGLGSVLKDASQAADKAEVDSELKGLQADLASLSPAQRAIIYRLAAEYTDRRIAPAQGKKKEQAREKLADLVKFLIKQFKSKSQA